MNHTRSLNVRTSGRLLPALIVAAAILSHPSLLCAANPSDSPYLGDPVVSPDPGAASGAPTLRVVGYSPGGNSADLDPYFQVPGGGSGIEGRIGHIAGEAVGRDESLTHINLQPYVFVDQNMLFSDLRLYRLNEGGVGGNVGAGLRRYLAAHDAVFGAIAYFDVDDTKRQEFQQLGLSLEYLSRWLDLRANWYVPIGDKEQILGTGFVDGSQRFFENSLLIDATTTFGNAAEGVDVTATVPVPWEMLRPYNVEASAGFYHYQARDVDLPELWGYRLRADASFFDRVLHTFVELTSDRQFDTRVVFGASLDYYGGFENRSRIKDRQYYRMSEFVRRNYNVVTIDSTVVTPDTPVINPLTGDPYFIVHVDNTDGPDLGTGTFEDPFDLITQAFTETADLYFVHGGSSFTGDEATLVVPEGAMLLGENVPGRPQTIPTANVGPIELPVANPGQGPVTLSNSTGSAIDATDALLVGAFTIVDANENGLLFMGPSGLGMPQLMRDLTIQGADGDGILFDGSSGVYGLERVTVQADDGIDGAGGAAFHVSGGNAVITAADPDANLMNPTFENSGGNPNEIILIENITGGTIDLTSTASVDTGGGGIRLLSNAGNIAIGTASLTDTGMSVGPVGVGAGVEIFEGTGNITFFEDITVTNAAGVGFLVDSLEETGLVNVTAPAVIEINQRNAVGAEFRNVAGSVTFSPTLSSGAASGARLEIGALNAATDTFDPAVLFRQSSGFVSVNDVSIANSNSDGILIGGNLMADQNVVTTNPDGTITRPRFTATGTTDINFTGDTVALGTAAIRIQGAAIDDATNPLGEPAIVDFRDTVIINDRVDRGVHIENNSGQVLMSAMTTVNTAVTGALISRRAGLWINNSIGRSSFGTFITDNTFSTVANPSEPAVEIHNIPFGGAVGFSQLSIRNAQGDGADVPGGGGDPNIAEPEDTTGLLVTDVSSFSIAGGDIDVMDGIAVDIERVFPQLNPGAADPGRIVRDNQNRPILLNDLGDPVAVLDQNGDVVVDDMGVPIAPPSIFTLTPFAGYQVLLTSVDAEATTPATAQLFGIYLEDNTGTFEIQGTPGGAIPSGGRIAGSLIAGLFADNADRVTIRRQDYDGNDVGMIFQDMNANTNQGVLLDTVRVQNSIQEAVVSTNVRNVTIIDSFFTNNGFIDLDPDANNEIFADTIRLVVTERPDDPFDPDDQNSPESVPYNYTIDGNTFLDTTSTTRSDAIHVFTPPGGFVRGAFLSLFARNNFFQSFDRGIFANDTPKLVHVEWNGILNATVSGNAGTMLTRNSVRGFEFRQTFPDDTTAANQFRSNVVVANNTLDFNDSPNAIGTLFDFIGTANIDLTGNVYDMGDGGATGGLFRLFGENSNNVEISDNIFDFGTVAANVGTGVGIDVQQVVGGAFPSAFFINGNIIGTTAADAANTAFQFQTVVGQVNLFGTIQNTVFANTFFTPLNNPDINGSININGQQLP